MLGYDVEVDSAYAMLALPQPARGTGPRGLNPGLQAALMIYVSAGAGADEFRRREQVVRADATILVHLGISWFLWFSPCCMCLLRPDAFLRRGDGPVKRAASLPLILLR